MKAVTLLNQLIINMANNKSVSLQLILASNFSVTLSCLIDKLKINAILK